MFIKLLLLNFLKISFPRLPRPRRDSADIVDASLGEWEFSKNQVPTVADGFNKNFISKQEEEVELLKNA